MRDGIELHTCIKENGSPVWLIATHGIGEHLARHHYLSELCGKDFNIFQYDLRGHGMSMGDRGYVADFSLYREDLLEIITFLRNKYKMQRYVLFGHSMGALITAAFIQQYTDDEYYPERLVLNAPPAGMPGALGEVIKYAPSSLIEKLSSLSMGTRLGGLVDLRNLSHDPHVYEDYIGDELNCQKLHTKLLLGLVNTSKQVFSRPIRPKCPAYCSVGSEDQIVSVGALKHYFSMVDKSFQFKIFDGAYHEIHNEIEKYRKPYFEYLRNVFMEVRYDQ